MTNYIEQNKYDLLSKFESVREFNNHFEQAMVEVKDYFTKSEYIALNKLRKFAYSEKNTSTIGVAWCKIQKAVASTHMDALIGVSRSTFDRMLRKARKINLITVINQERDNKWQKHNVFVFNRLEEIVVPATEEVRIVSNSNTIDAPESMKIDAPLTINLSELPKQKDINTYPQAENVAIKDESIKSLETKTPYQQLRELIDGLFSDVKMTYKLYGVWLAHTKRMISKPSFELALLAVKTLISEIKRRQSLELEPLRNPVGYFNGTLVKMLDKWLENEVAEVYEYIATNEHKASWLQTSGDESAQKGPAWLFW